RSFVPPCFALYRSLRPPPPSPRPPRPAATQPTPQTGPRTTDYGLRTTDYGLSTRSADEHHPPERDCGCAEAKQVRVQQTETASVGGEVHAQKPGDPGGNGRQRCGRPCPPRI